MTKPGEASLVVPGASHDTADSVGKISEIQETATPDNTSNDGVDEVDDIDEERTRARLLLTPEEEKRLLRRIDWHLMPLCSLLFMFKNLDSDNVSNARIMNQGTDMNIMTQLGMTSDQYNLVTVLYYVSLYQVPQTVSGRSLPAGDKASIHRCGGTVEFTSETLLAVKMAGQDRCNLGCCPSLSLRRD